MQEGQLVLPSIPGPALVVGPVFLCFEYAAGVSKKRKRQQPVVPFKHKHGARIAYNRGGKPFVHEYPHPESHAWEKAIGQLAMIHMRGRKPSDRPLALLVHAFVPVPPSWSAREQESAISGAALPTSKPDWDNFGKVTDALNGVAWLDDAQVVDGRVIKRYSTQPALRIEVREFVAPSPLSP
jgi:Holliday junction resolvase RusA-like endonuclease